MKKNKTNKKIKIQITDIMIATLIIIIFGFSLLSFFPGLLTSDGIDQIQQAEENKYISAHPIIHSFIIGNLAKLGGIWVPALFQIVTFALIWTYGCRLIRNYNNTRKNAIFQIIVTFILCIIPLNFLYSITLWKDILYSYSILAVLLFVYVGVKEKYKYTIPQLIWIGFSTVAVMKFRHNGVPIGFLMFAILAVLNFKNNKNFKQLAILLLSFIISFLIMTVPEWLCEKRVVETQGGNVLNSTKVYCLGALLNTDIKLEKEETEFLNTILDVEEWKKGYNPYTAGGIVYHKDFDHSILTTPEANEELNQIFIKYAKQKPLTVIQHFFSVNSIWWSIPELGGMHSIVLTNDWVSDLCDGKYDNHPILKGGNKFLTEYSNASMETEARYNILYRPAVALYISIILVVVFCVKEKKIGYVLLLLPMLLNIGTYVFLISSQDQRYFYPNFMTAYLCILISGEIFLTTKKRNRSKKEKTMRRKNKKILVIVPAYNEAKSIEKVVNSIEEQKIENCDILVVNDGSQDDTYQKAKNTKAIVIDSPNNLGIGGAVQTGYLYGYENDYDIAIQIDGDGQHDPKYIKDLVAEIENGSDLVIGSRFVKKTGYNQKFFRMLGNNIISFLIQVSTKVKLYDTTSGYRAVNRNIMEEFVEFYPYDYPEPCTNMSMIKKGYQVKEVPVEMKQREAGESFVSPMKAVSYMLKVTLAILLMGIKE